MTDKEYMELALVEAKKAEKKSEIPIGSVIVYQDTIIAATHNLCESKQDATAHAEILAIQKASKVLHNWRLTGCTLYVTIEPCPMCAGAIRNARISRIVYGSTNPQYGALHSISEREFGEAVKHISITHGVLESECQYMLDAFFEERRTTL